MSFSENKTMNRIISVMMIMVMIAGLMAGCGKKTIELKEIDKYFYEVGTYTSLDYDYANKYFAENNDNWGGGCSAISADIGGKRLVGRNLDLNISNKCAYLVRTDVPNKYETFGLVYTFRDISPDYEVVKKDGIGEKFEKILPFMCDDVVNSKGLHIEINMRHNEKDKNGNDVFGVEHTNKSAAERIYVFNLTQYVCLNCKDLQDVKKYIANDVDVYSQKNYWNYSFVITDAKGNSALLEFGNGKYYWVEKDENGIVAQTNFYVNKECNEKENIKTGLGRYDTIKNGIKNVKNEKELYELMDKVAYSWFYSNYEDCKNNHFDPRSEIIGEENDAGIDLTYDLVMSAENEKLISGYFAEESKYINSMTREEKQAKNIFWESSFTEVVNPAEKTIKVRLFEDESKIYEVSFKGIEKISGFSDK